MRLQYDRYDGRSRCLDAFTVALNQTSGHGAWYTWTAQLQLASLQLCISCRSVPSLDLRVKSYTPEPLWARPPDRETRRAKQRRVGRVPILRARVVIWELSSETLRLSGEGLASAQRFIFNNPTIDRIDGRVWPPALKELFLGMMFDSPFENMVWPSSLVKVSLGSNFNQPIHQVTWPASLRNLSFGSLFDQPIDLATWPSSLTELWFGRSFNQPIHQTVWPPSLELLKLGRDFDQPLHEVAWPVSLRSLFFLRCSVSSSRPGSLASIASEYAIFWRGEERLYRPRCVARVTQ
ncbi:unnamed protein product [Ectocarpus sp. 12 AP-2014]